MAQREGDVLVGTVYHRIRNEHVPWNRVEGMQYGEVVHSTRLQAFDQAPPVTAVRRVYPPSIHERTSLIRR